MTYTPKHRAEPVVRWRVEYMESERGWGQSYWHVDFDTEDYARTAYNETNARNRAQDAPAYYIQAISIKRVVL